MSRRYPWFVLSCLILAACVSGCGNGDTGPKRYRLSGTVVYEGKPVPAGVITFEPDASQGNQGSQGYAEIRNGAFDTANSKSLGVIGGPTVITISGLATAEQNSEVVADKLFPDYVIREDLPRENLVKEFNVLTLPAAAGKKR